MIPMTTGSWGSLDVAVSGWVGAVDHV